MRVLLLASFKQKNINNFLDIKSKDVLIIGLGYVGLT